MTKYLYVLLTAVIMGVLGLIAFCAISGGSTPVLDSLWLSALPYGIIATLSAVLWLLTYHFKIRHGLSPYDHFEIAMAIPCIGSCLTCTIYGIAEFIVYFWFFIPFSLLTLFLIKRVTR